MEASGTARRKEESQWKSCSDFRCLPLQSSRISSSQMPVGLGDTAGPSFSLSSVFSLKCRVEMRINLISNQGDKNEQRGNGRAQKMLPSHVQLCI